METKLPNALKPLIRWTIGSYELDPIGLECLKTSVICFKKIYNNIDTIITYNCFPKHFLDKLKQVSEITETPIYEQRLSENKLIIPPKQNHGSWKLCPARLRPQSHEIFIDNDLVIFRKNNRINKFLENTKYAIITADIDRFYGSLEFDLPMNLKCCNGFFGLPPYYDLDAAINQSLNTLSYKKWEAYHDEQSMVIHAMHRDFQSNMLQIPIEEISVCALNTFKAATHGHHFVGLNRGRINAWNHWLNRRQKLL